MEPYRRSPYTPLRHGQRKLHPFAIIPLLLFLVKILYAFLISTYLLHILSITGSPTRTESNLFHMYASNLFYVYLMDVNG